jgi:primosomal protein N' (replication factor Y)
MTVYVEIIVNVPQVTGVFHYHLPPGLEKRVQIGHLVVVPFGSRRVQGVVLREVDQPAVADTRPVEKLVDPHAVLTPAQLALAERIAERTLSPLAASVNLMLPPGLGQQSDTIYHLTEAAQKANLRLTDLQKRLIQMLSRRGSLRGRQIDRAIPRINWRRSASSLLRRGLLTTESVLRPPTVRPKTVRTVQLACTPETAHAQMDDLGRAGSKALKRRQKILDFLLQEPGPLDVSRVYAESGGNLSDLRRLAARGLVVLGESHIWRDPLEDLNVPLTEPPPLTKDQQEVWEQVRSGIHTANAGERTDPFILHGVTGSGKTEVYLHAVAETLRLGRDAIVLVPEIALTPQTVRRFMARFPGQIGLIHSQLSSGERYDTWRRARAGELSVVVGPRSALFTPLPRPGLIVLDESHDDSYYQFDSPPNYHARRAAIDYAQLTGSVCLLGSATPDTVSYHLAREGSWNLLELPDRILAHQDAVRAQVVRLGLESRYRALQDRAEYMDMPPVQVVDMRAELKAGNRSIFSRALEEELSLVLARGQQAILFLNRRGTATYVFCRDCGHSMRCPRCELPLTYHRAEGALTCHHCNYRRNMPTTCPQCGSERIRGYGTGTERVEREVQKLFPQARTLRWDWETTRKKGAHDAILRNFTHHESDILIGTQMLAKGLDLPLVTLVGVVLADVGLNLPDYRAAERTFQVLSQVAGRAGRSPLGGLVVLQTFLPEHNVIRSAARHDYLSFHRQELEQRRALGYPPFRQLVRLTYRHYDPSQAESAARLLHEEIQGWIRQGGHRATETIGPAPCFYSRLDGFYRWQIILKGPDPTSVLRGQKLGDWQVEVNPPSLL